MKLSERAIKLVHRDDLAAWCIEEARKEDISLYAWLNKHSQDKYTHKSYTAVELICLYNDEEL